MPTGSEGAEVEFSPVMTMEEQEAIFGPMFGYQAHQPGLHELMQELRQLIDTYEGDKVLVGEAEEIDFYGTGDNEVHLVFNFPLMRPQRLTPKEIRANQAERLAALPFGAWPCNTLGNHDQSRVWNRFGDGQHDSALARLHLALLLTLKGTPFLYYGEEIGMSDLELSRLDQLRDFTALNTYRIAVEQKGISPQEALKIAARASRDRCRTPMQWSNEPNAGFSPPEIETWLPVNPNFAERVNVAEQEADSGSLLNFYRAMLKLRKANPALLAGEYRELHPHSEEILAFQRHDGQTGQDCLVILNFSSEEQIVPLSLGGKGLRQLFAWPSCSEATFPLEKLCLTPFQIFICELV